MMLMLDAGTTLARASAPCRKVLVVVQKSHHSMLAGHSEKPTFEKISCMRDFTPSRNSACTTTQQWEHGSGAKAE
jgi:hypothetical protein